jgi:hypothetical protein
MQVGKKHLQAMMNELVRTTQDTEEIASVLAETVCCICAIVGQTMPEDGHASFLEKVREKLEI